MEEAEDFDLTFHRLFHGGLPPDYCLKIGEVPKEVCQFMNWNPVPIVLTGYDTQKIRFHPMHGLALEQARMVLPTISDGDYYYHNRGGGRQVEIVYHVPGREKEVYFAVIAYDKVGRVAHFRTFYRSTNMTRSKFKGGVRLRWVSGVDYFLGLS
ncbi:MAG: hypothetical protein ACRC14_07330 [Paracoccaceae bacterium]